MGGSVIQLTDTNYQVQDARYLSQSIIFADLRLVLLENSRSSLPALASFQDFMEPLVTPMSKSCRWNDDIISIAKDNALSLEYSDSKQLGTIALNVFKKSVVKQNDVTQENY